MNNIGIWGALFGVGILLLVGKYVILRRMRKADKQIVAMPAPLPMPGFSTVRVTTYILDEENAPEWVQQLFADDSHPGPEPTYAELQDAIFAEVKRLGIKIPE